MTRIFAALVTSDDDGVRKDHSKVIARSRTRGASTIRFAVSGTQPNNEALTKLMTMRSVPVFREALIGAWKVYQLLGCTYSPPSVGSPDAPPFRSSSDDWLVAIDGTVTNRSGLEVADLIASVGWTSAVEKLDGQFAIVALSRSHHGVLFWAAKAKPLYGLFDTLGRCVRVASQREFFDGLYHPIRSAQPFQLGPYRYGTLTSEGLLNDVPFRMNRGVGTLVLCGGGLDSLVASWKVQAQYPSDDSILLYVDYCARAGMREWTATQSIARELDATFPGRTSAVRVYTDFFKKWANSTPLIHSDGGVQVSKTPIGGIASEWVPARNTVLMSLGIAFAEANGLARIVTGINADAASAYPDNEQEWQNRFRNLVPYAVGTDRTLELISPLETLSKTEIAKLGDELEIPWSKIASWSCYEGGKLHCGLCSSCRYRRSAFIAAGFTDPTKYEELPLGWTKYEELPLG